MYVGGTCFFTFDVIVRSWVGHSSIHCPCNLLRAMVWHPNGPSRLLRHADTSRIEPGHALSTSNLKSKFLISVEHQTRTHDSTRIRNDTDVLLFGGVATVAAAGGVIVVVFPHNFLGDTWLIRVKG